MFARCVRSALTLAILIVSTTISATGTLAWESFVHVKTQSMAEAHLVVSDQALALLVSSADGYTVQVYRQPDGKLLWQKSFADVNTKIAPFQIVGQWLCLYGSQGSGSWRNLIFELETGKDLYDVTGEKVWNQALQGQGLNEPIVAAYGNRVVVARMANFAVFDLKERRWFKPDTTQNLSFLIVIDQYVLALDKKSQYKPVLFSLVDGSVRRIDVPLSKKELESLRADFYSRHVAPVYHWRTDFPMLLTCSDFNRTNSLLMLTHSNKGSIITMESLGLEADERWRILFQKAVKINAESILVAVLRPDTPSVGDRAVLIIFDSSGHVLARKEVEFTDLYHITVHQHNLLFAYSDYTTSRVVSFKLPTLEIAWEKDCGSFWETLGKVAETENRIFLEITYDAEPGKSVRAIVGLEKHDGSIGAYYPLREAMDLRVMSGGTNSSSLFFSLGFIDSHEVKILRIPHTSPGWLDATLSVAEPIYPNSTVEVNFSPAFAVLSANAGQVSQNKFWTSPNDPGTYMLTLSVAGVKKDFPVKVSEYVLALNLPELVYTNSDVPLSYTPEVAEVTSNGGRIEGKIWRTPDKPGTYTITLKTPRASREFKVNVLPKDTDKDGVSDWKERLQGSNPQNPDTDGDGLDDGRDLSPTIDPSQPNWTQFKDLQEPGMIRVEQPVMFYGLHGWVDVYVLNPSGELVYLRRTETDGVRHSKMDEDSYRENLNRLFEESGFVVYDMKPAGNRFTMSWRSTPDYKSEFQYAFLADALHPNEYRFYYDYLQDCRLVYLKNSKAIRYPSPNKSYKYLLLPVRLVQGYRNRITVQFRDYDMWSNLNYVNDADYKIPGFLYSFYASNNFNDDANLPYQQGLAFALIEDTGVLRFTLDVPKENVHARGYLKLTPVWVIRKNNVTSYDPMVVKWNITGITREVIAEQDSSGNSWVLCEHLSSFEGLDVVPVFKEQFSSTAQSAASSFETFKIVQKEPAEQGDSFTAMEVVQKITMIALESGKRICSLTEAVVKSKYRVDDLDKLPDGHWAKSAEFGLMKSNLEVITGAVSIVSSGYEAWMAFKEGDYVTATYYGLKALSTSVSVAPELVNIAKTSFGYTGKATKLSVISSTRGQVALAIAVGAIEVGYDVYKYANTDDPILKKAYAEKIAADTIDTTFAVIGEIYPPVKAALLTWTIEVEIYSWIFGQDLGYRVCRTPGTAIVFLWQYFVTDVPSAFAEEAYENARNRLVEIVKNENEIMRGQYISIFVEPPTK
ncbi:hypothetical protein [Pseudothermotoga sp.]